MDMGHEFGKNFESGEYCYKITCGGLTISDRVTFFNLGKFKKKSLVGSVATPLFKSSPSPESYKLVIIPAKFSGEKDVLSWVKI